jgi:hypothetical protein
MLQLTDFETRTLMDNGGKFEFETFRQKLFGTFLCSPFCQGFKWF